MILMLTTSHRNLGLSCIRCQYRARLRCLQQQRLRSSHTEVHKANAAFSELPSYIRRTNTQDDRPQRNRKTAFRLSTSKKEWSSGRDDASDQLVRKFLTRDVGDYKSNERRKEHTFREALQHALTKVKEDVQHAPVIDQVAKEKEEWDGESSKELKFGRLWKAFTQNILQAGAASNVSGGLKWDNDDKSKYQQDLWDNLIAAFRARGLSGLEDRIKYSFYAHVTGSRFTQSDIMNQKALADLRYPYEWYPATRSMKRSIHLHVGPTNSGKTYHALQRLEAAETGVYAGPLRLLAHEVYSRMNAKGKPCALVTGEERRLPMLDGKSVTAAGGPVEELLGRTIACTVEMMPLNTTVDVAVIDEIQMIGNSERGWAWTQAFLGVKAKEVHLCGEERTVPIIRELCASIGEKLEIHRYERLSPLQVSEKSLDGDLRRLRKGDCIVSFSVIGIHALRKQIEKSTGRKVATVYGSLPPETRAQQARLFNDPDNEYDYLVASDAVGMGLNLAIKRIIFESSSKFNGIARQTLDIADIKQIGGRAGRFRTSAQANEAPASAADLAAARGEAMLDQEAVQNDDTPENVGLVTTLERFDFPIIRAAMAADAEPITTAGLFPPASVLERFASYFPPGTPFSYILTRLHELSQIHSRFHLCGLRDQVYLADIIESVQGLTITDRNIMCNCPANKSDNDMWKTLMPALARCIADQKGGHLADIEELPLEVLEAELSPTREYLRKLEGLHKGIVAYLWLSYRFAGIFPTRALAFHAKQIVEDRIETTMRQMSFSEAQRRSLVKRREQDLLASLGSGEEEEGKESVTTAATDEARSEDNAPIVDEEETTADLSFTEPPHSTRGEYEELVPGDELDGGQRRHHRSAKEPAHLEEQTSMIGGGDCFTAGGDDVPIMGRGRVRARVERKENAAVSTNADKTAEMKAGDHNKKTKEAAADGV